MSDKYRCALVIGAPGSGKGNVCRYATTQRPDRFCSIGTGDLFRRQAENPDHEMAKELEYLAQGGLGSDDAATALLLNELKAYKEQGIYVGGQHTLLLDGYPRTMGQVHLLNGLAEIESVIYLECPEEVVVSRMLQRGKKQGRPEDQKLSSIQKRYQDFCMTTAFVLAHYTLRNLVTSFDTNRPSGVAAAEVLELLLSKS